MRRSLLLQLLVALVALVLCGAEPALDKQKLVGEWRYEDEPQQQAAHYVFRDDGRFTAELSLANKVVRKLEGNWMIEQGMIVYTYDVDSLGEISSGARERDTLERLDETFYTIVGGDGGHRTYWRVKETR